MHIHKVPGVHTKANQYNIFQLKPTFPSVKVNSSGSRETTNYLLWFKLRMWLDVLPSISAFPLSTKYLQNKYDRDEGLENKQNNNIRVLVNNACLSNLHFDSYFSSVLQILAIEINLTYA
jgi:hypothetical protein